MNKLLLITENPEKKGKTDEDPEHLNLTLVHANYKLVLN